MGVFCHQSTTQSLKVASATTFSTFLAYPYAFFIDQFWHCFDVPKEN